MALLRVRMGKRVETADRSFESDSGHGWIFAVSFDDGGGGGGRLGGDGGGGIDVGMVCGWWWAVRVSRVNQ